MHKKSAVLSFALLAACSGGPAEVAEFTDDLFVASGTIWPSPTIAVCWDGDYAAADEALVQGAVTRWGTNSNVRFTGWTKCAFSSQGGIHITVADGTCSNSAPTCVANLGKSIDGKSNGVTLNFTFNAAPITINTDPAYCTRSNANRQWCITTTAVHEFGHALGFSHEQNRPDSGSGCGSQGTNGDVTIGPWDSASVMEYCNAVYNNNGQPSFWDTVGVQQFYGARLVSFNGSTQGTPAVGQNLDGRMWVFTLDSVGRLVYSLQSSVNGPFAPWSDFGFVAKFPPTVARNSDGRLAVFAVDNNGATWVSQQVSPNSYFGPMVSLGGVTLFQPTVGQNLDGRLEVFVVGSSRQLWHRWQDSPGGAFVYVTATGGWVPMDGTYTLATQPVIGTNVDGTMEVFGVNWADGGPIHARQSRPNDYFYNWVRLDGVMTKWTPLVVARNADGRLELFGLGYYDLALYHWTQNGANSASFSSISRLTWTKTFSWMPAVFTNADGTLEIIGASREAGLAHAWQITPNLQFTDFFSLRGAPGFSPEVQGVPAVGVNQDGRREVFVAGTNGNLMHAWQTSATRLVEPNRTVMRGLIWY